MKFYTTLLLLALPLVSAQAQDTYLMSDFEGSKPLDGYTLENVDGVNVKVTTVKGVTPAKTWFAGQGVSNNTSKVMLSMSCRNNAEVPTDNWLITPAVTVKSADAWLEWDAQSVHHDLPESYEVLVGTDPDDVLAFQPIYTNQAESYYWTHRMVSLKDYVGQTIYLAFRHTSLNKYLLAVDNIRVGTLEKGHFTLEDQTEHSAALNAPTGVHGTITNLGANVDNYVLRCTGTLPDGTSEIHTQPLTLQSNESADFHFDVPAKLNKATKYQLDVLDESNGLVQSLVTDSLFTSNYPRTLFMEKATAYWCTSCPKANPFSYAMEKRMGKQFVEAVVQYPTNNGVDTGKMVCEEYLNKFRVMNLPTTRYNRYSECQDGANYADMMKAYFRSTYAFAQLSSATLIGQTVKVKGSAEFAFDFNNEADNYRMGFIMIEDGVNSPLPQENICSTPGNNEWYYLPSKYAYPLNTYKFVVREGKTAFDGVANSFPAQIVKQTPYDVEYSFELPAKVRNVYQDEAAKTSNLSVIALVLNTKTGEVLNASQMQVDVNGYQTSISQTSTSDAEPRLVKDADNYQAVFPHGETATVSVYALDGRLLHQSKQPGFSLCAYPSGTYLVRLQSASGLTKTFKLIK